jgi:site-specific DNA-methyltransferase (adenine-specific)
MIELIMGDCLEKMKDVESGSVDLILTDPPYGTIEGLGDGDVSHGMKNKTSWDAVIDQEKMLEECNRILRPNGGLILFSQEPYTGKLTTQTHGNLPFSYRMTWVKDHFANSLIAKKAPVSYAEDICVFFKKYDTLAQHPLRDYAEKVKEFIGLTKKEVFGILGNQGICHFYRTDSTQFGLCTEKTYNELIEKFNINEMNGFVEYSELKEIDRDFSVLSPKVFNLPEHKKYKSNILEYKKDYTGHHPTQKPVKLLEDLIYTYTSPGDTTLDFTMGSGSTGVAAKNLGRNFIGIEKDLNYFRIAQDRIQKENK